MGGGVGAKGVGCRVVDCKSTDWHSVRIMPATSSYQPRRVVCRVPLEAFGLWGNVATLFAPILIDRPQQQQQQPPRATHQRQQHHHLVFELHICSLIAISDKRVKVTVNAQTAILRYEAKLRLLNYPRNPE